MTPVRLLALVLALVSLPMPQRPAREVCFTVDDLPFVSAVPRPLVDVEAQTRKLLAGFARHKIPAIGFVNENKANTLGALKLWIEAGHELGNHTYSHMDLHFNPVEAFTKDIVRGEPATTRLLGKRPRYFRHPMLHTGRPLESKQAVDRFLADRGYRVAPVTIDNYDYLFANAYDRAAAADRPRIRTAYLEYMAAIVAFYEQQSVAIVGREIRQTLLMHANALNADTIDDLARLFTARGYSFITLDRALEDPAYQMPDTYAGPAGMTWLHRWAMTAGMPGTTFAGEPTVPDWIERAAAKK